MTSSLLKKARNLEIIAQAGAGKLEPSVYGVVDRVDNIEGNLVPNFIRRWKGTIGNMEPTDEEPTIYVIEKLEPLLLKHKKYKCLFGGRAGTKSIMAFDTMVGEVNSNGSKVFCLRERMTSLRESIYEGIRHRIEVQATGGFTPVPSRWEIRHKSRGKFQFGGMQNIIDMKGTVNYKFFLSEEAARTSQQTLDTLGPTLRGVPGAELWFVWNPESSTDAMSTEFIVPYQADLDKYGYYEDEYHLIIKVGYEDNPWFEHDESLSTEFAKDQEKVEDGRMSQSRFNHIWKGAFSDDIDDSIIIADWFDAAIDAHKKLGFEPTGAKVVGHDPADTGNDAKGFAGRHGVVIKELKEIDAENANRAFDIACREAIGFDCDSFGWDCDGLGAVLRDQADKAFKGKHIKSYMYKGSESCHDPEAIFKASENYNMKGQKKNKDVFKNKKAQNITAVAERFRKTYEAVVKDKYHDPDELISIDSSSISPEMIAKLRAEACRIPLKPSDKITFYTKEEMRRGVKTSNGTMKIPSPNLFDAIVVSFDKSSIISKTPRAVMPPPIKRYRMR